MAMDFMDHDLKGLMMAMAAKNIFFTASEVFGRNSREK